MYSKGCRIGNLKPHIVPYFDYGDIFIVGTNQKTKDKLQKLQNQALRTCSAMDGRSY